MLYIPNFKTEKQKRETEFLNLARFEKRQTRQLTKQQKNRRLLEAEFPSPAILQSLGLFLCPIFFQELQE
ncbi:MAG: hypothetical protein AB1391_01585 [Candidatus Micrarchaeota archaeon]